MLTLVKEDWDDYINISQNRLHCKNITRCKEAYLVVINELIHRGNMIIINALESYPRAFTSLTFIEHST